MKHLLTTLTQVIFEILGDMFFLFPEHYDSGDDVVFPNNWIKYRLKMEQGDSFWLNFYFTPQQARLMAENFLGEDAGEISDEIIGETLKEAVNVIGGNLLNRMEEDYRLGIPEPAPTENLAQLKRFCKENRCAILNVEDQPFLAVIE